MAPPSQHNINAFRAHINLTYTIQFRYFLLVAAYLIEININIYKAANKTIKLMWVHTNLLGTKRVRSATQRGEK